MTSYRTLLCTLSMDMELSNPTLGHAIGEEIWNCLEKSIDQMVRNYQFLCHWIQDLMLFSAVLLTIHHLVKNSSGAYSWGCLWMVSSAEVGPDQLS